MVHGDYVRTVLVAQAQDTNLSSFEDPFNLITGFRPGGYAIRTRFYLPFLLGLVLLTSPYCIVMPPYVLVSRVDYGRRVASQPSISRSPSPN